MAFPTCGDLFEGYRLDAILGEGGSATVFRARELAKSRDVALKIIRPNTAEGYSTSLSRRIEREVTVLRGLRDPHTVELFASGRSQSGLFYLVFELVEGKDLAQILNERGVLPVDVVVKILIQVLASLREAHASGLLHRDIKPENIRVSFDAPDTVFAKVLDFGIARTLDVQASITKTGDVVGTPRYIAPEVLLDRPMSPSADIYSLGIVAWEMLVGRTAIHGNSWDEQFDRLQTGYVFRFPHMGHVPADLRQILDRMSARDAEDRYASAAAVLKDLDALEHAGAAPTAPATREARTTAFQRVEQPLPPRRTKRFVVGSAAVVLVVVLGGWLAWPQHDRELPVPPARTRLVVVPPPTAPSTRSTIDAGSSLAIPDASAVDMGVSACGGPPPFVGFRRLAIEHEGATQRWSVVVPTDYDSTRHYPVVIAFHHDQSSSTEFIAQTGLRALADSEGVLVIGMDANKSRAWRDDREANAAQIVLEELERGFCVDRRRVFVVGHGTGAFAADWLSCQPWVTAVATAAFMPERRAFRCPDRPKPSLHLAHDGTKHVPLDGGPTCGFPPRQTLSLDEYVQLWRGRNGCEEQSSETTHTEGICRRFTCDTPFVSCLIHGGHGWPGSKPRGLGRDPFRCDGTPGSFPSTQVIWEFFASVPPLSEPAAQ